jgi:hypothetical protein
MSSPSVCLAFVTLKNISVAPFHKSQRGVTYDGSHFVIVFSVTTKFREDSIFPLPLTFRRWEQGIGSAQVTRIDEEASGNCEKYKRRRKIVGKV